MGTLAAAAFFPQMRLKITIEPYSKFNTLLEDQQIGREMALAAT